MENRLWKMHQFLFLFFDMLCDHYRWPYIALSEAYLYRGSATEGLSKEHGSGDAARACKPHAAPWSVAPGGIIFPRLRATSLDPTLPLYHRGKTGRESLFS